MAMCKLVCLSIVAQCLLMCIYTILLAGILIMVANSGLQASNVQEGYFVQEGCLEENLGSHSIDTTFSSKQVNARKAECV